MMNTSTITRAPITKMSTKMTTTNQPIETSTEYSTGETESSIEPSTHLPPESTTSPTSTSQPFTTTPTNCYLTEEIYMHAFNFYFLIDCKF